MASASVVPSFLTRLVQRIADIVFQAVVAVLIVLGYLFLALFIYVVLREIIVPEKVHLRPVHFFFHPACQEWSANVPCGPSGCNYPVAFLDLDPGREPILASRQPYRVVLELEMPESPTNMNAGMFMVNLTMMSKEGETILTSLRPGALHYRSMLLQIVDTVLSLIPLLFGSREEKQVVPVVLHEDYIDSFMKPVVSVKVTLLKCKLEVYSAVLRIEAELRSLTYYLYYYPVSMAFVLGFLIFLFLSICSLTIWSRRCTRQIQHRLRSIMTSREGSPRPRQRSRRRDGSTHQSRRRRAVGLGSGEASPETLVSTAGEGNTELPQGVGMQVAADEGEGELRHRVREPRD